MGLAGALHGLRHACGARATPQTPRSRQAPTPYRKKRRRMTPPVAHSGFRLMPQGVLLARMRASSSSPAAQHSLDLQYTCWRNDGAWRIAAAHAREEAALRGRARAAARRRPLHGCTRTSYSGHCRPRRTSRCGCSTRSAARGGLRAGSPPRRFDIPRLNHRMHNNLFIADGRVAGWADAILPMNISC
jgi:putative cardiolipin synthase